MILFICFSFPSTRSTQEAAKEPEITGFWTVKAFGEGVQVTRVVETLNSYTRKATNQSQGHPNSLAI